MIQYTVAVKGMACSMCEAHVNDAVRKACPVKKVRSSHSNGETEIVAPEELDEQEELDVLFLLSPEKKYIN